MGDWLGLSLSDPSARASGRVDDEYNADATILSLNWNGKVVGRMVAIY